MPRFLKAMGILLILSGIGLFLISTSSAVDVGSRPVRNQYEDVGRAIGVGIGWTSVNCVSLILFVSGVFTWWAGHNAGKSRSVSITTTTEPQQETPSRSEPKQRKIATAQQQNNRPIYVRSDGKSVKSIIIGWTLIVYAIYAGFHLYSWSECEGNSALFTLFPLRQAYLVRAVEERWNVRDNTIRKLILATSTGRDRASIMHIVKHGDCILLYAAIKNATEEVDTTHSVNAPKPAETTPLSTPASEHFIVTSKVGKLNIRRGPGLEFGVIGSLNRGQSAIALARNNAGDWIKIASGWISSHYIDSNDDIAGLEVST